MGKLFDDLVQGIQEATEDAEGKRQLKSHTYQIEPLKEFDAQKIKDIRKSTGLSQRLFAYYLGVSTKTVEAWEAGTNNPSGVACRLLYMVEMDPQIGETYHFAKLR